jgi:uncharacterized protein involved in type VI secretion and phage assembly
MAGNGRGIYFVPEVDDEVLVAFEHGDVNRPYVLGSLWNGRDTPPKPASQVVGSTGKVDQRIVKSRLGHTITLDDSDSQPSITIVDKTEKNLIKLDYKTNQLTAQVEGDMLLEAKGTVTVKGRAVDVQATSDLKLKGATGSVEATGRLNVKGATATVEGSSQLEVKGGLVRIN